MTSDTQLLASVPEPGPSGLTDLVQSVLEDKIGSFIATALKKVAKGTEEDLRLFGAQVARNALVAGMRGDSDLLGEVRAQVDMLLEVNRIRVDREHRELIVGFIEATARSIFKVALTAGVSWTEEHLIEQIRR